ncbi:MULTISPECIES: phospholipid-binding protein MlaC [Photobacterium]|uniref:Toluene tolerance protein n=1 Tax=Photobacterium halotolerans TaxID=265726 RepID=A0A0F5VDQ6_9GAMM|nr:MULTISPECIES: phospholipid-binding protein MlaC [Photobacterium]KKC99941.1 toluene tolerance protein [Photobacterium halotolerans]UIP28293.1 phospholipid-binding protein MlaC [Photobacterium sp. TLY01]
MKFLKILWLTIACLPLFAGAATVDKTDPYKMMQTVSQQTFARLKSEQAQIQRNPDYLRTVVRQELLPYINTRYAAYKVLGPQLKQTTKEQRNNFVNAFTDYLVASYAQVLTQYKDQEIRMEPVKSVPASSSIVSIRVDILDPQRPPIRLDFKLRKNKQTNEWQGYDMVAEGVSMISTKQSEWSGQLRTEGVDKVTQDLRALAAKPIKPEEK